MTENKRDRLLTETLGANEGEAFARIAATHARRRHITRRAAAGIGAGLAGSIVTILFITNRPNPPASPIVAPVPTVEIISDQELMEQLKGHPTLFLKNATGITQVILLADK